MLYRPYQAYDPVDRTLLWTVLARFGVPQNMISVIRQFHDGMRACVRLNACVCSGWFAVKQGRRQGCVLAPVLFSIFFAAVTYVAYTRFKAVKAIMGALVHLGKEKEARGGGKQLAESQSLRRRCGACFTLTMAESYRNPPSS